MKYFTWLLQSLLSIIKERVPHFKMTRYQIKENMIMID